MEKTNPLLKADKAELSDGVKTCSPSYENEHTTKRHQPLAHWPVSKLAMTCKLTQEQ